MVKALNKIKNSTRVKASLVKATISPQRLK